MAKKRMFNRQIVRSDAFVSMSLEAQALYFQLAMDSDEDGFVENTLSISRTLSAKSQHYDELVTRRFVLHFSKNGYDDICIIKHHLINNEIRKENRYTTPHVEELATLKVKENRAYTEIEKKPLQDHGKVTVNPPQIDGADGVGLLNSVVEVSLDKLSLDKLRETTSGKIPYKEIIDHLNTKKGNGSRITVTESYKKFINGRYKDGFTYKDFIKVIDNMVSAWLHDDKMFKHLYPDTLFNATKFPKYLNWQSEPEEEVLF